MASATESNPVSADQVRQQLVGKHVCPFCGVVRADAQQPCPRCTMEDTPATRIATRQRIGPWFVLQARNPSAPGMKFATLLSLVKKGHVTPRSIVRGPTTHQLWTFAARVRGLSREQGFCWHCGEAIEPSTTLCRHCDRPQEPPTDPDALLELPGSPELNVSSVPVNADTGMDGGTSLDLQVEPVDGPAGTDRDDDRTADLLALADHEPARAAAPQRPATPMRPRPASLPAVRQGPPVKEESILTARELAAAFQLDFKPPANAAARRRPLGAGKVFVVLLLTLIAAGALVLYLRPDWRDRGQAWATQTWAAVRSSLEQPASQALPKAPEAAPVAPKAPVIPPAVPKPTPAVTPEPAPTPAPVIEQPVPTAPVPVPAPAPTPPVVERPRPEPAVPPPELSIEQATALAQQLRSKAIDAEGKDWPAALSLYEQIERLPRDAWPADLPLRLTRARERAGQ